MFESDSEIQEAQTDELAMELLRRFSRYTGSVEPWLTNQVPRPLNANTAVAVAEAWAWLENHGMVVRELGQSDGFRKVSRRGTDAMRLLSMDNLPVEPMEMIRIQKYWTQ